MSKSCVWTPKKGKDVFNRLRKNFGYSTSATIFNKVRGDLFINMFRDTLSFTAEGVPTYDSIIKNKLVRDFIGELKLLESFKNEFPHYADTRDNNAILVLLAIDFNKENKDFTAYVDYDENGNLTLLVEKTNDKAKSIILTQLKIQQLNTRIVDLLKSVGITIDDLSEFEIAAGRVGETNFAHAKDIADNFTKLIRVANNMEGDNAISEEFSHLIIGIFREKPLVLRGINFFKIERNAREILGDEYLDVYDFHDGNTDLIAEEALGQLLLKAMINRQDLLILKVPLLKRIIDFILSPFKGMNPKYYSNEIDKIGKELSEFTESILLGDKKLSKDLIKLSERLVSFNALSERAKVQVKALKSAKERLYKLAYLTLNLDKRDLYTEKAKNRKFADTVSAELLKNLKDEETMEAIASLLDLSLDNIDDLMKQLSDLDNYDVQDKFVILKNALGKILAFGPIIDDLYEVTRKEYLSDEGISSQKFIAQSTDSNIKDVETLEEQVELVDTSNMSTLDISSRISKDSLEWELSDDEKRYVNKRTGVKAERVTSLILADKDVNPFDENSPWVIPSTNIGTGIDELVRDFFGDRMERINNEWTVDGKPLEEVYPNSNKKDLNMFVNLLTKFKKKLDEQGITIIPRDITVSGIVLVTDDAGKIHNVNVAGTLDLIGYDKNGKWHIYDMKTHRGKLSQEKKEKYARQVTLYKLFLELKYGITVDDINIIPIKVNYKAPIGTDHGTATYKVSDEKSESYRGRKGNQLIVDGEKFDGASPFLEDTIPLNERTTNLSYKKLSGDKTGGLGEGREAVLNSLEAVNRLYKELVSEFSQKAMPEFVKYLKPFVGETIRIKDKDGKMQDVSIQTVLENAPSDINFMTKWFTAMADSPDLMLLMFDRVYKRAKTEYRINTINKVLEIMALGKLYEQKGITNYDFMFEEDKHNYLNHTIINDKDYSYDKSAYNKAKEEYFKALDLLYGEHPEVGSEDYKNKYAAQQKWVKENTLRILDKDTLEWYEIPNNEFYPSKYNSLTDTLREFFDKWMDIKAELDMLLGPNKTTLTNTIKIRKTGIERAKDLLLGNIMSNLEELKSKVIKSYDDDLNYGASGIRGFNGEEIMKLPLYYVHNNGNDSDLSTDAIGTLAAYAEMAYNYEAMSQIVNPLEIGRELVKDRKPLVTRKGKLVKEKFTFAGVSINNPLYVEDSNIKQMLDNFFETKIYNRYLKDSGEIMGADVNKAVSLLLKLGSTVLLGFNAMAHLANAITGVSMLNIEAMAGEYFTARELVKADSEFAKSLGSYVGDIGQRVNNSKIALFDELFNVKLDFKKRSRKDFLNRTILTRVFGPSLLFFGQEAGDFWLYNRTAIAIAMKQKLKDSNGNEISLWDALEVVPIDSSNPDLGSKLVLKEGVTNNDGTAFTNNDIFQIGTYINGINKHLFGIYNDEDMIAAKSVIWGRFIMQYRDWIPTALVHRFRGRTYSLELGREYEGYYRTALRFTAQLAKEIKNGELNIRLLWSLLDNSEKANIRRTVTELTQWLGVSILAWLLSAGDDKDKKKKSFARAMASYMAKRESTELGALVPFMMPLEMLKMVQSPAASTNVIKDLSELGTLLNPLNYTDEIKSGDYKGHSSAYRAFYRSPITLWYRTIKRNLDPEKAQSFYDK